MKKRPKISVIIPVYNAEKYIAAALDSILNQNFRSYEILVINDGSTDNSLTIIEQYCQKHPKQMQVITQENAGAGAARNTGIEKASGKYILFMDADDVVEENMLRDLYASAVKYNSEVVFCPFYRHGLYQEVTIEGTFNLSPLKVYTGEDFIQTTENIITTCTKLYERSFIQQFRFPNFWFEDVALLPVMMSYAKKITYVPNPYYHYLRHDTSTVSKISSKQILGSVDAVRYIREHANPEIVHEVAPYIAQLLFFMCVRRPAFADLYINLLIEYKDFILENTDFSKHPHLESRLESYFREDYTTIPKQIFYDHFGKEPLSPVQEANIKGWNGTLVEFDGDIICLNEENCDISEHPLVEKAYQEGRYDAVGQYFKCKHVMEQGGVALSPNIRGYRYIVPLLTRTQAFFAFSGETSIASEIYASAAQEQSIKESFELLLKHMSEDAPMSAALSELFIQKQGLSCSYELERNFKSKYIEQYDGRVRIYSTNVLTRNYGLGTSIASISEKDPAVVTRDGEEYVEVNARYYQILQNITKDYVLYRKNLARQEIAKQNVKAQTKIAYLRGRIIEQAERIDVLKDRNNHYLSLINDIKRRKVIWFFYRISLKFFPPKKENFQEETEK